MYQIQVSGFLKKLCHIEVDMQLNGPREAHLYKTSIRPGKRMNVVCGLYKNLIANQEKKSLKLEKNHKTLNEIANILFLTIELEKRS